MALSLMLRNSPKLRGLSALPKCTFRIQKTQNFTQLVTKRSTNVLPVFSQCKFRFVNVAEQPKRKMSGDHSKMWTIEKLVSLIMLGVIPATFICPNPILDNVFAVMVVMHFHWGLEAVIVDYIRPIILGPIIPKLAILLLYLVSASTLGALIYFNQTQIGIGEAVKRFWCITGTPEDNEGEEEEPKWERED